MKRWMQNKTKKAETKEVASLSKAFMKSKKLELDEVVEEKCPNRLACIWDGSDG